MTEHITSFLAHLLKGALTCSSNQGYSETTYNNIEIVVEHLKENIRCMS